jgi:hypothetical protein
VEDLAVSAFRIPPMKRSKIGAPMYRTSRSNGRKIYAYYKCRRAALPEEADKPCRTFPQDRRDAWDVQHKRLPQRRCHIQPAKVDPELCKAFLKKRGWLN